MSQLPADEAFLRFQSNEERIDRFVNDAVGYSASGGQSVPSLRALAAQVTQFYAGIYASTSAGLAGTTNGKYFSVPSGAASAASLNLYLNNAGTATLVGVFPSQAIAQLGRVQFSRRGTTFLFNDPVGTSVEVGWTTLRFWKGDTNFRRVADRALSTLAAGKALFIDVATDIPTTDYPVQEADLTAIAADIVLGTKILLVANYADGYLVGEIAELLVNKEITNSIAAVQASATATATQARYARSKLTTSQSTFSYAFDSSTNVMTLSWVGLRMLRGTGTGVVFINDITNYALANQQALFVDMSLSSPLAVQEANYNDIAVDCITGSKFLLVANYFGSVIGEVAGFIRSEQVELKAEEAQLNSKDSRRIVTGTVTSAVPTGSSYTVSVSEGRSYKENNGGEPEFKIAPMSDVLLAAGECLVVDFIGGTKDANDRYIPVKLLVAQASATGWMTAKKYVIVGNAGFGSLFGAYRTAPPATSSSRKIGIHDGKVAFSTSTGTPLPTYDPNTRTLTWPELLIPIKDRVAPLQNRIKLQAGSITFPTGLYWVAALDLSQANYTLTPASAISIGNYFQGGWDGEDENLMPLFCVSNGISYPICFPPTVGSTTFPGSQGASSYDPSEIIVVQSADEVDIYMKGSNPSSNKYLRYRMQRKPNTSISSDVWRWNEVWEVSRSGDFTFQNVRQICNGGENEMAIRQKTKSDFMGGTAHGDEELFSVTMLIDGSYVALGGTGSYRCRRIEFLQGSNMFEVDTVPAKLNRLAKSYKRWVFEAGEVEIFNNVVWEAAVTLSLTFMTMLTFLRWNVNLQISDRGYRSPLYLEEDISDTYKVTMGLGGTNFVNGETVTITANDGTGTGMEGTATVDGTGAVTAIKVTENGSGYTIGEALTIASKTGAGAGATGTLAGGFSMVYTSAQIAKASGPTGYSAEVELLEGWDKPNRRFNFSNSASYNKFYFDYTGPDYVTQVGEVFKSRARYKIDTKN